MKVRLISLFPMALACGLMAGIGVARAASDEANAIQAVRQAPDPSSVVAAFASGSALTPDDPKLLDAYVRRMGELGMPEMAFHQAQALATVDPKNGLAWATVAYVDARRDDMPDALAAIDKAVRYSPDDLFVQRTAGGVAAWYDSNSSRQVSTRETEMLSDIKRVMGNRSAYATAYTTSKQAYSNPAPVLEQPQPGVPSVQTAPPAPLSTYAPPYPPDYPYTPDYGVLGPDEYTYYYPGYAAWDPWPWWEPPGYFYGSLFVPFGGFAFGDYYHHGPHHGFYGHGFDHDRFIAHGGGFAHHGFAHHGFAAGGYRAGTVDRGSFAAGDHRPTVFARPGLRSPANSFSRSQLRPSSGFPNARLTSPAWGSYRGRSFSGGTHGMGGVHGLNQGHVMGGGGMHGMGGMGRGGSFGGGHGGGHR